MAYYVIGDDGQKYGPADVATLNSWIAENRLVRTQMLEDEASGTRMAAGAVAGLNFPEAVQPAAAPGPGGYPGSPAGSAAYPRGNNYNADDGSGDLRLSYILGGIGLFCALFGVLCCFTQPVAIVLAIVGLVFAFKASGKGNMGTVGAKVLSILTIAIAVLWLIYVGVIAKKVITDPKFQEQIRQAQQPGGSPFPAPK